MSQKILVTGASGQLGHMVISALLKSLPASQIVAGARNTGRADDAYTLTDLAAEVARQSGKSIEYKDMPETEYRKVLIDAGLPEPVAALLADSSAAASRGTLFDEAHPESSDRPPDNAAC